MASSAPDEPPLTERIVRSERIIICAAIAVLAGLAWLWTASGAGMTADKADMGGMFATARPPVLLILVMWWVMMTAMMLPSAAPAILLYARVRRQTGGASVIAGSGVFLSGYLLAWLGVSAVAACLQLLATEVGLLDAMTMRATYPPLAGATLVACGLYQLSPLKSACLTNCRSPATFLSRHWRPGAAGALRLGLLHGGYCVGCCWLLMALLFVGGVMNFLWIALLTALIAAEKLLPPGQAIARAAGLVLILWGIAVIAT